MPADSGRFSQFGVPSRRGRGIFCSHGILCWIRLVCVGVLGWGAAGNFDGRAATGVGMTNAADVRLPVVTFACIGDFGSDSPGTRSVADQIRTWRPQFIITLGDNNYPAGSASTLDRHLGKFYHEYIHPYRGRYGRGAITNRFFPSLGNHDWITSNAAPYLAYFELPGNERYYSFVRGPVELFCVDSDPREPDGVTPGSKQGRWLEEALGASTSVWKIVYFHHAPYSSGFLHGSHTNESWHMRWPFKEWGASIVLSGHDHTYERIEVDGLTYIVNGLGGDSRDDFHQPPVAGSVVRYNAEVGVLRVDASARALTFRFLTWRGRVVDTFILRAPVPVGEAGGAPGSPGTSGAKPGRAVPSPGPSR